MTVTVTWVSGGLFREVAGAAAILRELGRAADMSTELEGLETEGFLSWSKNDYSKFLKECERSGRDEFAKIAEQVATKSVDEASQSTKPAGRSR